jgi:hypothetical protein
MMHGHWKSDSVPGAIMIGQDNVPHSLKRSFSPRPPRSRASGRSLYQMASIYVEPQSRYKGAVGKQRLSTQSTAGVHLDSNPGLPGKPAVT